MKSMAVVTTVLADVVEAAATASSSTHDEPGLSRSRVTAKATSPLPTGPFTHHGRIARMDYHVLHDGAVGDWARNVLLVMTPTGPVLIESGNGDNITPRGYVPDRLAELGIHTNEIKAVILSHADWDHIGGTVDPDGNPVFPNAIYMLPRKELEFWRERPERNRLDSPVDLDFRRLSNVIPIQRIAQLHQRIVPTESDGILWPGIRSSSLPGHTPGYSIIHIEDIDERLVYVGDMIFDTNALPDPTWVSPYDLDPATVVESRAKLLASAAARHDLLLAYHVTFPGLGRVTSSGKGYEWNPIPAA